MVNEKVMIFSKVKDILDNYPPEKRFTLAMLQDIQKEYKYIPKEAMLMVKDYLEIPLSNLYALATFYKALSLQPKGTYVIKVCAGTACHIKNSPVILNELEKILNIKPGETTKDGLFSLETVNCLGSCALAPVLVVNEDYYGKVTPPMIPKILSNYGGTAYAK